MKKVVLTCGLIAGSIVSAMIIVTMIVCYKSQNFEGSMWLGYAGMLLAFSMIFVGIKTYRDKYNNGVISFGKAFKIGLYIALIASTMYVLVWLITYYGFVPDFMDRYNDHVMNQLRTEGATAEAISKKTAEMKQWTDMYKTPFGVILLTYMEILPLGIVAALISAAILKRKNHNRVAVAV
jgi:ethanolamine transporter EutH